MISEAKRAYNKKYYIENKEAISRQKKEALANESEEDREKRLSKIRERSRELYHSDPEESRRKARLASTPEAKEKNNKRQRDKRANDPAHRAKLIKKDSERKNSPAGRQKNREWYHRRKEADPSFLESKRLVNKHRRKTDPQFAVACRIRARIGIAFRYNGVEKGKGTVEYLGCSIQDYRQYLESFFQDGMSWENRGDWVIDHRVPIAAFDLTDEDDCNLAFHFSNTQPLWKFENASKHARLIVDGVSLESKEDAMRQALLRKSLGMDALLEINRRLVPKL